MASYRAIEPYQAVALYQAVIPCLADTSFAAKVVASSLAIIADTWVVASLSQFTHHLDVEPSRLD